MQTALTSMVWAHRPLRHCTAAASAAAPTPLSVPSGWGDFKIGLVNDNSNIINVRMKKALQEGVSLSYQLRLC